MFATPKNYGISNISKKRKRIQNNSLIQKERKSIIENIKPKQKNLLIPAQPEQIHLKDAKICQMVKIMSKENANSLYLCDNTFNYIYDTYITNKITASSRGILKQLFLQQFGIARQALKQKETVITELQQINDTCMLFKKLACIRYDKNTLKLIRKQPELHELTINNEGIRQFIEDYKQYFNQNTIKLYKDVIINEIQQTDFSQYLDKEYSYDRQNKQFTPVQKNSTYVLYRNMKKTEYGYLLNYFKIKKQVEEIYNQTRIDTDKIDELLNQCGFKNIKDKTCLPLGAHLGNFEQALRYSSPDRILVEFKIKKGTDFACALAKMLKHFCWRTTALRAISY